MLGEVFFRICLGCGLRSENELHICPDCIEELERYPHECESCGFPSNVPAKVCGKCSGAHYRDRLRIAFKYKGAVKQLLRGIKFSYMTGGRKSLLPLLSAECFSAYDIVTDVPSHYTRKLRRISHPANATAKAIAESSGAAYVRALQRVRRTEYQYKLKRNLRHKNVKDAFICNYDVTGLKILLVDDIITTGSTIEECSRILKKSGASIVDVFALTGGSV